MWGAAHDAANATRLKVDLALREGNILDTSGKLTDFAIRESELASGAKILIKNPKVIAVLTRNGEDIHNWRKFATPSIALSTGQRIRAHYYRNIVTGEINYDIDFKVKGMIYPYPSGPKPEPVVLPYEP